MHNTFTLPSKTYIDLDQPDIYQRFMQEYLQLLRSNLKQNKVMDQNGAFTRDPVFMRPGT